MSKLGKIVSIDFKWAHNEKGESIRVDCKKRLFIITKEYLGNKVGLSNGDVVSICSETDANGNYVAFS